jgi:hypothetical protein
MSETNTTDDCGSESQPAPATSVSSYYQCRVKRTGFGDYVACLETPPHHCGYALHMGEEYLCLHPHHLEFAARTESGC